MNGFLQSQRTSRPPVADLPAYRGWLVLAAVVVAGLLYAASPLPSLEGFDRHDTVFARARLVGLVAWDLITSPHETWVYWEGPERTQWLLDRFGVLLAAGGILLVSLLAGAMLVSVCAKSHHFFLLEWGAFSVGLGLSAVSSFVRVLGFFPLSRGQFVGICGAAALVVLAAAIWALRGASGLLSARAAHQPAAATVGRIGNPWWLAGPLIVVIVLGGLLPPLDFDVLAYHLQAPKEFFQQGHVTFLPHNVYASMPLGSEMFSLLGMIVTGGWWTGALVGKTIMSAYALAAALAVWAFGRRLGGPAVGGLSAILYLATPWTIRLANLGLNENALALYLVLTAHAAYLWSTERRSRLLLLAGFFAGSGVSIKYTGMLFVVAPLVLFVMGFAYRAGKAGTRGGVRSAALAGLAIAAGCWPWLAANWWHTGNPVFPLLGDWLGSSTRDAVQIAQWDAAHRPPNFSLADLGGRFADFMWQSEWHNPLLLALGVLTLVFARAKWAKFVAGYVAFYFAAWWLLTHRLDRFWTPALPAMALVAGGVATLEIGRFGRQIARWSIGLWVAICLLWAAHPASLCGYARFLAPYDWLEKDPARVPLWRQAINELAGGDGAVLAVGDAAVFDVHPRVYYNTVFDRWLLGEWLGAAEEWPVRARGLHAELAARGIEYVYVHWDELARYRRTYDRDFRRSDFITPQLFDRIIAEGVLTPLATRLAGANVSLFAVNEWEADVK